MLSTNEFVYNIFFSMRAWVLSQSYNLNEHLFMLWLLTGGIIYFCGQMKHFKLSSKGQKPNTFIILRVINMQRYTEQLTIGHSL